MHQVMEYSALAGAAWLSSNVLFVIVWSWTHSRRRRWMSEGSMKPSIFKMLSNDSYLRANQPRHATGPISLL